MAYITGTYEVQPAFLIYFFGKKYVWCIIWKKTVIQCCLAICVPRKRQNICTAVKVILQWNQMILFHSDKVWNKQHRKWKSLHHNMVEEQYKKKDNLTKSRIIATANVCICCWTVTVVWLEDCVLATVCRGIYGFVFSSIRNIRVCSFPGLVN